MWASSAAGLLFTPRPAWGKRSSPHTTQTTECTYTCYAAMHARAAGRVTAYRVPVPPILSLYRHFGTINSTTNEWTRGQSQMPKLWHGTRILSGLVAKVKMAKMTEM